MFWLVPTPFWTSGPVKSDQFALTWTVLVVALRSARVWCSAWVRVCWLSAGPASAANTQPQTSRASASVLPAAAPTVRLRRRPGLMLTPRRAVRRRGLAAARW